MVGVSGLEPEASWSRTKRDTKLRHTPMRPEHSNMIHYFPSFVKGVCEIFLTIFANTGGCT